MLGFLSCASSRHRPHTQQPERPPGAGPQAVVISGRNPAVHRSLASRSALIRALTSKMVFAAITANSVQKRMGSHNFPLPSCSFTQARYVRGMVKPFGSSQDRWRAESTSPSRLAWQGEALARPLKSRHQFKL